MDLHLLLKPTKLKITLSFILIVIAKILTGFIYRTYFPLIAIIIYLRRHSLSYFFQHISNPLVLILLCLAPLLAYIISAIVDRFTQQNKALTRITTIIAIILALMLILLFLIPKDATDCECRGITIGMKISEALGFPNNHYCIGQVYACRRFLFSAIDGAATSVIIETPPGFEEPMTLSRQVIWLHVPRPEVVGVGFYNKLGLQTNVTLNLDKCLQGQDNTTSHFSIETTPPRIVFPNDLAGFAMGFQYIEPYKKGLHVCTLRLDVQSENFSTSYSKDLFIQVE
jgi:hypothetical protein